MNKSLNDTIWDSLDERTENAVERIYEFKNLISIAEENPEIIIEGKLNYYEDVLELLGIKTHRFQDKVYGILIPYLEGKFEGFHFDYSRNMYASSLGVGYGNSGLLYVDIKRQTISRINPLNAVGVDNEIYKINLQLKERLKDKGILSGEVARLKDQNPIVKRLKRNEEENVDSLKLKLETVEISISKLEKTIKEKEKEYNKAVEFDKLLIEKQKEIIDFFGDYGYNLFS